MTVKPVSLPRRNLLNRQAFSASARPYRVMRMTPSKLFPATSEQQAAPQPEFEEPTHEYEYSKSYGTLGQPRGEYYSGMNKNDRLAFLEDKYYEGVKSGEIDPNNPDWDWKGALNEYVAQYKIPETEMTRLKGLPAGEMPDPSMALAEGVSNPGGFAPIGHTNEAALAAQKGQYGKAASHGLQAILGATVGLPATVVGTLLGTISQMGKQGLEALGIIGGEPANLGSSVASGTGVSGLSGPMGLAGVESGLADIGVDPGVGFGDFGGTDTGMGMIGALGESGGGYGEGGPGGGVGGGLGGGPGGTPGGLSGGVGTW